MHFFLHDSMPIMHLDIHANMSPKKKNSRRHINTFCESDKNKNRCQNNDGKTTSQERFIDQIDSKWRWILRNKENNNNKKSFIGFKSVAYLSSIKTRFNRSVARTVLFFASHFYTFTGLRMQCIRSFRFFFLAQRDARPIHCNCMPFVKCILLNIRSRWNSLNENDIWLNEFDKTTKNTNKNQKKKVKSEKKM